MSGQVVRGSVAGGMRRYLPFVRARLKYNPIESDKLDCVEVDSRAVVLLYLIAHVPIVFFCCYFIIVLPRGPYTLLTSILPLTAWLVLLVSLFIAVRSIFEIVARRVISVGLAEPHQVCYERRLGSMVLWSRPVAPASEVVIRDVYVCAVFLTGLVRRSVQKTWVVGIMNGQSIEVVMSSRDHDEALYWIEVLSSSLAIRKQSGLPDSELPEGMLSFAPLF